MYLCVFIYIYLSFSFLSFSFYERSVLSAVWCGTITCPCIRFTTSRIVLYCEYPFILLTFWHYLLFNYYYYSHVVCVHQQPQQIPCMFKLLNKAILILIWFWSTLNRDHRTQFAICNYLLSRCLGDTTLFKMNPSVRPPPAARRPSP